MNFKKMNDWFQSDECRQSIKNHIRQKKPRCAICGKFFGVEDVMMGKIISVIKNDNHFTGEDKWFEHKKCRGYNNEAVSRKRAFPTVYKSFR